MQVLNRYVAQGVDATLITLTIGVLIAVALELAFREARMALADRVSAKPDEDVAALSYDVLTRARLEALERVPPEMRREILGGINSVEQAYNASNISAVLDVPFALLFIFVLALLSPVLALIVTLFVAAVFIGGLLAQMSVQKQTTELTNASGKTSTLMSTAIRESETVRVFNAGGFLRKAWNGQTRLSQALRRLVGSRQAMVQSFNQTANTLMSVAVIVAAGVLTVRGQLDVGAMLGANILAARALQPISRFSQLGSTFAKAKQALDLLREFAKLPLERERGSAISSYSGALEFRDVAFNYHGNNNPLFESLSLKVEPGSVLVVTGANGTGKTTLARLILGLYEPTRGFVLADGLDLKQMASEWWRKQVIYLPQEPSLLNATLEENLRINNPDVEPARLNEVIDMAGLRRFVDESQNGLETQIVDNGWRLSEGMRRRIALARALLTDGRIALFDEPIESFDAEGIATVHAILSRFARDGRTIIVMSHDPKMVKGRHTVLDLNQKPAPSVTTVPGVVEGERQRA
jgi:ATP-binding cassette subfamily C protein LapB